MEKRWHVIGTDVVDSDGFCVADCAASGRIPLEKMQDNAKLIAAAPELLNACKSMVDRCNLDNLENLIPEYEIMCSAINKATE